VDKANFITPETTRLLRSRTALLVHFTPDCAFYSNQSHLFEKSIPYYDWFISSKSFERQYYPQEKLIEITQGYDPGVHQRISGFEDKTRNVCFIGLYEKSRGDMVNVLLGAEIQIMLGGMGWKKYKNLNHPKVEYLGEKVFGNHYTEALGSSRFGLGLLSKRFPELHTTRTFEIPACGTALITERNTDTSRFFTEEEVIFYDNISEIPDKLIHLTNNLPELERITQNGYKKVTDGLYSYEKILQKVLEKIGHTR
jgi:glycosyltransferase involved in cell wall biosynthesis